MVTEEVSKKHQEEISGNEKGGRGKHNSDVESPESPNSQNDVISPMSPDYSSILHKKNPSEMIKADWDRFSYFFLYRESIISFVYSSTITVYN